MTRPRRFAGVFHAITDRARLRANFVFFIVCRCRGLLPAGTVLSDRISPPNRHVMITCYLRYIIDPLKLNEFEAYGKMWIPLVEKFGGQHHGYFLPSEGANNVALALFSFPSLATYEDYRQQSQLDAQCQAAFKYAEETRCIVSYERSFFRPVFS